MIRADERYVIHHRYAINAKRETLAAIERGDKSKAEDWMRAYFGHLEERNSQRTIIVWLTSKGFPPTKTNDKYAHLSWP